MGRAAIQCNKPTPPRLEERWSTWQQLRAAPVEQIETAIAPGGLSNIKSARIKQVPKRVASDPLPGVARKTAACVLLFAYGLHDIPVDTHVGRVGQRLGLFREKASFEEMHDAITAWTPQGLAHAEHVNMIRHGRRICHKRAPECRVCPLREICPSAKFFLATSA